MLLLVLALLFSLNKCTDSSKNKKHKLQYLIALKNDILSDKVILEKNIIEIDKKITICDEIIPFLRTDYSKKMSLIRKVFSISSISNFIAKDVTYKTLINSGDLKLIGDFELKSAIEEHYSNYKTMLKSYERQEIIHKEYLGKYYINHVDYDALKKGEFGFENEKLLKNIIQSIKGSLTIKSKATQKGIESCDKIIIKLSKALK